jgi:hypothetical protein
VIGSGRPRLAYTATDLVADEGHPGAYRLLARILTSSLQGRDGGLEEATPGGPPSRAPPGRGTKGARGRPANDCCACSPRPPRVRPATRERGSRWIARH